MQPRHHYELAFEEYLRLRRMPYVAVHEARKALLPANLAGGEDKGQTAALKSFDFVIYGPQTNLLVEIKGRKIGGPSPRPSPIPDTLVRPRFRTVRRLENWATQDDIDSLLSWERLFGAGFSAALVFVYWCQEQPPAPLFEDIFEFRERWYAIRVVLAAQYALAMKPRSPRWRTVHIPAAEFNRLSRPLSALAAG